MTNQETLIEFNYTGTSIEFEIPYACVCKLECWGAAGATRNAAGGYGGYACGKYRFKAHQKIQINVGGAGDGITGGFNGGGNSNSYGGGGGGASDIRIDGFTLNDRIIVAGGGGGAQAGYGGYGGGLIGGDGQDKFGDPGLGGTQTEGGGGPVKGTFGIGANATTGSDGNYGGAGGGGWYGGGGGSTDGSSVDDSGGGGGSSYIALLEEGVTYAGNQKMPSPNGQNMVGNSGHGYVRITILEAKMAYYAILQDNKYYIPTPDFYDGENYIPVTKEFLKDKRNCNKFLYDASLINMKTILNKFKFKEIKIVKFFRKHITDMKEIESYFFSANDYSKNISFNYDPIKDHLLKGNISINITNNNDLDYNIIKNVGTNNIKVGISNNKYLYGKDMCKISKEEIIDNGIDIEDLKNYIIPFDNYKLIMCFTDGDEKLVAIKQTGFNNYKYKTIADKNINITTDYKNIYISSDKNINKLLINKLSNDKTIYSKLEKVY